MEEELFEPFDYSELLQEDDQMRKESICFSPIDKKGSPKRFNSGSSACLRFRNASAKKGFDVASTLNSKIKLYTQSMKRLKELREGSEGARKEEKGEGNTEIVFFKLFNLNSLNRK